ncbi:S8 family serine peptidase [Streptoalloteichus hindustanus]|uniref:Type VII secretion-associated serine protease mycosin n=1 Tax=Streptoalloteichus hindustanus TaxID=2017 RepID=A0A1M4UUC6_STRHI|nr:S8 family serine peptidase [Streptoalloteichus hindustanus]SHE60326.1 type VII secretion-associated serine protease mycosin [Streptoalloteichus hindustanus]
MWSPLPGRLLLSVLVVALVSLLAGPAAAGETIRERQWHLDTLDVPAAQTRARGEGVVVAVVDSGVDAGHPALADRVLPGTGFGDSEGDDGRHDRGAEGHGTAMAGLIVGRGGRPDLLLGVAPAAKVLPVALGSERKYGVHRLSDAIRWAADHRASVINLSVGGEGEPSPEVVAAVRYALDKDVVVVAAAGNAERTGQRVTQPGNIPGVLTVAGLDRSGQPWSGSARGPEVVLAAPAAEVISTAPTSVFASGYALTSGTSSAAAIVSGVAALVRSAHPGLSAANVVNRLVRTARDVGSPGRDEQTGFGVVNPVAAVTADVPAVAENPLLPADGDAALFAGGAGGGSWWREVGVGPVRLPLVAVAAILVLGPLLALAALWRGVASRRRAAAAVAPAVAPACSSPGSAAVPEKEEFGESWVDRPAADASATVRCRCPDHSPAVGS